MTGRNRSIGSAGLAVVIFVAGCVGQGVGGGASLPPGDEATFLRQRAAALLERWATPTGGSRPELVAVGALTDQIGDWELEVGDNNKRALMSGLLEATFPLTAEIPPDGTVRWPDGRSATYRLLSAQQAIDELKAEATGGDCDDCTPLRITSAKLATGSIETNRGTADVPLWEFAIAGTAVIVTRLAVADRAQSEPEQFDWQLAPDAVWLESASIGADGTHLTVYFTGAPDPGDKPCGEDYAAEAVESEAAVAVIVVRLPRTWPPRDPSQPAGCTDVGARRSATVILARPLAERIVLDVPMGQPIATVAAT